MARIRARNARVRSLIEIIIDHRNPRATGYLKKAYLPGDQSTTSRVWIYTLIPTTQNQNSPHPCVSFGPPSAFSGIGFTN